jgi:hypothetical protein
MNLLQKIKLLVQLNKSFDSLEGDYKMNHSYFSTEFVSKVVLQLLIIIGACYAIIPPNYALIAVTGLTALYMILRQIDKIKNPKGPGIPPLPPIAGLPVVNELTTTTTVSTTPTTPPSV